ncbi:MAG TPA: hypothetical protein VH592_07720 [Gemmataceae bacterium]|jgi:hypothetical protein
MNLLCPNCQKQVTISDDFAGQLMNCPLCGGLFTVPGLPGAAQLPPPAPVQGTDVYSIRPEPSPPPPPPPQISTVLPPSPEPAAPQTPSLKPSLGLQDYQMTLAASLSPGVLPWIAPACLILVFFLQFFPWDGLYPGGEPAVTGNAWYAAFGAYSVDGDLKNYVLFTEDEKYQPGVSVLTIFYLLLFFPSLIITVGSVVILMVPVKLPPQVNNLLPWRWGIVAAVNLVLFLFLALQLLLGFSLDSRYREWVDKETKLDAKSNPTTQARKESDVKRGELLERLQHTVWLRLVVLLHLIAIVSSALMFWMDRRGTHRPRPKLELKW